MQLRRPDRAPDSDPLDRPDLVTASETLRSASNPVHTKSDEDRMSLFWRVFGGTILSVCALVVITLFNHLNTSLSELRADVARLHEARADSVKKDEFNTRSTTMWDRVQSLQGQLTTHGAAANNLQAELTSLKERWTKQSTDLDAVRKDVASAVETARKEFAGSTDAIRKDLAVVDVLKERVTALEGLKKDLAALESVKEKVAAIAVSLKSQQDDLGKIRLDVDRNLAADQERKSRRDLLQTQTEEALKELTKGLQDCREKLARLEGPTTPAKTAPDKKPGG